MRSDWPVQVTPQHGQWVNRRLAERGERPFYSETGRKLAPSVKRVSLATRRRQRLAA